MVTTFIKVTFIFFVIGGVAALAIGILSQIRAWKTLRALQLNEADLHAEVAGLRDQVGALQGEVDQLREMLAKKQDQVRLGST